MRIPLQVDVLSMLHKETKSILCYDVLVESMCRSLRLIEHSFLEQLSQFNKIYVSKCYHMYPEGLGHFWTCVYPVDESIKEEGSQNLI